jgi:DNA replication licensing factor MCM7
LDRHAQLRAQANGQDVPDLNRVLGRCYDVRFVPRSGDKLKRLREIGAANVGELVTVRGIITRASDVQAQIDVQTYLCRSCGAEVFQEVHAREYNPLSECPSDVCRANRQKGSLVQTMLGSKFSRLQEFKLQELPSEVPIGHVPRSVTVRAHGDLVRLCKPGDVVSMAGVFLPQMSTGFRASRSRLTMDTYIDAHTITLAKKNYSEMDLSEEELETVIDLGASEGIYERLAQSISPEIYGHLDVKKAMLLSLVGGVTKTMSDGLRIRGDINVLLVGDPGMAKSQMLKHVTKVAPRSVYTTGKGSSGVGLTAAVLRDPVTGDMTLEGGALVLADMGVCCIDEFDKMDESDRTAIHEVMEQQTVSIAKAGITTTLNARTTVLAAANPAYGRYNLHLSPSENLDMPPALLSRFDLLFVMIDRPNMEADSALARHVTFVHRNNTHPPLNFDPFPAALLRAYISRAKMVEPTVPRELTDYIGTQYVDLRVSSNAQDKRVVRARDESEFNPRGAFCTARSLLSILRLSQAVARVYFCEEVTQEHVEEALRLVNSSKIALDEQERRDADARQGAHHDKQSAIWSVVEGMLAGNKMVPRQQVMDQLRRKGFTDEQSEVVLRVYTDMNIIAQVDELIIYV